MKCWQDLEEWVANLIHWNNPVKPKGSGNAKKEEDVISDSFIVQCKYTEDKNVSILAKDLERLIEACQLQDKFPLFVTSSKTGDIISIPVNSWTKDLVETMLKSIASNISLEQIIEYIERKDITLDQLNSIDPKLKSTISISNRLANDIKDKYTRIRKNQEKLYLDLTTYNLFEGEDNVTK